jgi:hypothetical protein
VKHTEDGLVILLVYVDDMLIAAASLKDVEAVKTLIMIKFEARDMGEAGLFLGMSIVRNRSEKVLWLHQGRYARDVVGRFGMAEASGISAPMARETRLRRGEEAGDQGNLPTGLVTRMAALCAEVATDPVEIDHVDMLADGLNQLTQHAANERTMTLLLYLRTPSTSIIAGAELRNYVQQLMYYGNIALLSVVFTDLLR